MPPRTILVTRHAEKSGHSNVPILNVAGTTRTQRLRNSSPQRSG